MIQVSQNRTTVRQERFFNPVLRFFSRLDRFVFRRTGKSLLGMFGTSAPTLLLTTIGRKSGKPRTTPLLYLRDGDELVIVASKGGMPHHPLWYLNLSDNPQVTVEIEGKQAEMVARQATAAEKDRLWQRLVKMYPDYDVYQQRTDRDIPVVILSPR